MIHVAAPANYRDRPFFLTWSPYYTLSPGVHWSTTCCVHPFDEFSGGWGRSAIIFNEWQIKWPPNIQTNVSELMTRTRILTVTTPLTSTRTGQGSSWSRHSDDFPLNKPTPFAFQKGFEEIAGTLNQTIEGRIISS